MPWYTFLLFNFKFSIAISKQTKPRAAESRHIFIFYIYIYIFQGRIISLLLLRLLLPPTEAFPFAINIQAISLFAVISKQNDKSYNHITLYHGDQRRTITRLGSRVGTINNPTPIPRERNPLIADKYARQILSFAERERNTFSTFFYPLSLSLPL